MSHRPAAPRRALPSVVLIALALATPGVAAQRALPSKMVAAPPTEMLAGGLRLPDPAASAQRSRSAWMPVRPDARGVFELRAPARAGGALELLLVTPSPEALRLRVAAPDAEALTLEEAAARGWLERRVDDLSAVAEGARGVRVSLRSPRDGSWTLRVEGADGGALPPEPRAALLLADDVDAPRLVTRLANWELHAGGAPALLAHVERAAAPGVVLRELSAAMLLEVRDAAGARQLLRFADDGRHADGAADDGVFGAWLPTEVPGELALRVVAEGVTAEGAFLRTRQLRLPMHAESVVLSGRARAQVVDPLHVEFALGVDGPASRDTLQVSAEVWTRDGRDAARPVAWLSTMTSSAEGAARHGGVASLALQLDLRWLARAGGGGALELRDVRVQHPDTHVPLARAAHVTLPPVFLPDAAFASPGPVTAGMLTGSERVRLSALAGASGSVGPSGAAPGGPRAPVAVDPNQLPGAGPMPEPVRALMLVHGYCSGLAWNPAHFTGERLVFMDPNQSRSHDEFAQLIGETGLAVDSFGVVGHSQGGPAALQLFTYYMSGLDLAEGPRRIQSVGSPYQGTPLAGDLAALGDIFGTGCGTNFDLTYDGSALWLAGIPNWARAEVHYYTTSTGGFWCDFFTNLVLDNPEDGVVEMSKGQLVGANNEGHKTGWCHTTGMNDPAQYNDTARNAVMDALAAR